MSPPLMDLETETEDAGKRVKGRLGSIGGMPLVTLTREAEAMLRERIDGSGFARAVIRIDMAEPVGGRPDPFDIEDDREWTNKRKELWTLSVGAGDGIPDGDSRIVVADGIRFVSDFFPIRFDISVKEGRLLVAASAA